MYPKNYLAKEIAHVLDVIGGQVILPRYLKIHLHVIGSLVTEITGIHLFEKKSRTPEGVPERLFYIQDISFNNDESIYSIDFDEYDIIFSEYFRHPNFWKMSDLAEIEDKVKSYKDMYELVRICHDVEVRAWSFYNVAKKPRSGKYNTLKPKDKQKPLQIPVFDIFVPGSHSNTSRKQILSLEKELRKYDRLKSVPVFDYGPALYKVIEMMEEVSASGQDECLVWQDFFYNIINHPFAEQLLYFDGHKLVTGGSGEYIKRIFEEK